MRTTRAARTWAAARLRRGGKDFSLSVTKGGSMCRRAIVAGPPPRPLDRLKLKVEDGAVYIAYQDFRLGVSESVAVS